MKNKKIIPIVVIILLLIIIPLSFITYLNIKEKQNLKTNKCTEKGNICTLDDIFEGVEVLVKVSKNEEYVFNVISNDENTMTLLLNENLKREVDWHKELINIKGPQYILEELLSITKNWSNIDIISNYEYKDSGKINYDEQCKNNTAEEGYDCSTTYHASRGYNSLVIKDGTVTLNTNITPTIPGEEVDNTYTLTSSKARARLITREEINSITRGNGYPTWFISNLDEKDGYWTLTSATSIKSSYSQGAVAIARKNKEVSIEDLFVMKGYEPDYTIGLRPVIVVNKK